MKWEALNDLLTDLHKRTLRIAPHWLLASSLYLLYVRFYLILNLHRESGLSRQARFISLRSPTWPVGTLRCTRCNREALHRSLAERRSQQLKARCTTFHCVVPCRDRTTSEISLLPTTYPRRLVAHLIVPSRWTFNEQRTTEKTTWSIH